MSRYLAVYDVTSNKQRKKIADVLLNYGDRLQRSVFEVWLAGSQVRDLRRKIGPLLDVNDQFELVPIDCGRGRGRWRWGESNHSTDPVVLMFRDRPDPEPQSSSQNSS